MRELRFRAWVDGKYYYNVGISPFSVLIYSDTGNKLSVPQIIGEIGIECDGLAVEQFTGLYDKNGKEIYEGDIVNHGDNFPSVVKYDEKECAFRLFEDKPKYAKGYKFYPRDHEITAYTSPIEVIGTIHDPH